jgi:hypothetical protein
VLSYLPDVVDASRTSGFPVAGTPAGTVVVRAVGISQQRDGSFRFVASQGHVVPGPLLKIGNTTSRVDCTASRSACRRAWSSIPATMAPGVNNAP